ncbi:MAG TPA: PD-(D/E)XK nuclease family protein [Acidimicrobiales bacterium]
MLADVLAELSGWPAGAEPAGGPARLDDVRGQLEAAAAEAVGVGGWTECEPLRLSKASVTWLVRCPRRAVAPAEVDTSDELVLGSIIDAAAKLAALGARRPITAETALAYLDALGDSVAADHLAAAGPGAGALMAEAQERVDRLVAAWPAVEPAWWPRVEEPARVRLAGGAITVTGRLDALLGGPPTGRPGVVVEVKGGRWYDGMRGDAHLYALLVALRDGEAPARVVTLVADGTTQVEPIRPALIEHAAERVEAAISEAARLAAGEVAEARPGSYCGHCPVRADCSVAAGASAATPAEPSAVPLAAPLDPEPAASPLAAARAGAEAVPVEVSP